MAITTEKLLKLSQFQTGLEAAKGYTDGEIAKANAEIATVKGNVSTNTDAIATLNGNAGTTGSVDNKVATAIAGIMENPDETMNSIKELVDWTQGHAEDALELNNNVSANGNAIAALQDKVDTGGQTVSAYVASQGFLTDADIVIDVATDEEVTQICNTVFGTTAA